VNRKRVSLAQLENCAYIELVCVDKENKPFGQSRRLYLTSKQRRVLASSIMPALNKEISPNGINTQSSISQLRVVPSQPSIQENNSKEDEQAQRRANLLRKNEMERYKYNFAKRA
jgi:hypothetical protein